MAWSSKTTPAELLCTTASKRPPSSTSPNSSSESSLVYDPNGILTCDMLRSLGQGLLWGRRSRALFSFRICRKMQKSYRGLAGRSFFYAQRSEMTPNFLIGACQLLQNITVTFSVQTRFPSCIKPPILRLILAHHAFSTIGP